MKSTDMAAGAWLAAALALASGAKANPAAPDSFALAKLRAVRDSLQGRSLDMHCHVAGIGAGGSGCFLSPGIRGSLKFPLYLRAFGVSEKELLARGDGLVVRRLAEGLESSQSTGAAVVLALDAVIGKSGEIDSGRTQVYVPDAFVARETRKYPKLLYGASVNPMRRDALARLAQAKRDGALLVKWLPSIQLFDPADTAFIPFYRELVRLDLPLLTHTGKESSFKTAQDDLGDPRRLRLPLEMGVTVIAAHVATRGKNQGEDNMQRIFSLFPDHPNLYADISSLTQINKLGLLGKVLARPELKGRLMNGTDYPLVRTLLVSPYYFPLRLSVSRMVRIGRIRNIWDRDVALKKALGAPDEIFELGEKILLPEP